MTKAETETYNRDRQTDRRTYKQAGIQKQRHTDRQTDRDRQTYTHTGNLRYIQTDRQCQRDRPRDGNRHCN